jgi:hypothetical protein
VAQLTAQGIAGMAVALLTRQMVLPATVSMVDGGDFSGGNGDTVTIRVPQPTTAREQANPGDTITYDTLTEVPVDVTLKHFYHATRITDESLTYELVDFARQITLPQVEAVASKAEDQIASVINARAADITIAADGSDIDAAVLEARTTLRRNKVPLTDLYLAVSPEVSEFLLAQDHMKDVSAAGTPSALRDAIVGRYRGFTVVESAGLDAGEAAAYHRSGIAWGNLRPATPRGANDTATHTAGGVTLRQIFDYDPDVLSDRSVVSTFAGAALVAEDGTGTNGTDFKRIVKFATAAS